MISLQPMTEEEFASLKPWMIEDYTNSLATNHHLPFDRARAGAAKAIDRLLSKGLSTPNQFLYSVMLCESGSETRIGYLWIEIDDEQKRCFIAQIYLDPRFRRRGFGRQVLEHLEARLKQQAIDGIALHVFARNRGAVGLYTKMGYQTTGLHMQKLLGD
jgi:ribosomal protein S18 acetylase RimI-like enzyme